MVDDGIRAEVQILRQDLAAKQNEAAGLQMQVGLLQDKIALLKAKLKKARDMYIYDANPWDEEYSRPMYPLAEMEARFDEVMAEVEKN